MPDYTIIVPAYNEQFYLPATLSSIRAAMQAVPGTGELVVVDNNSSDETAEIARNNGALVVFEPLNQISRARNTGARQARGRNLVFVDADTLISPQLLSQALQNLDTGRCVGGGAMVAADKPLPASMRAVLGVWNWIGCTFRLAAGCFVYCRRDAFEATGGFSEKVYASEELWLSIAMKRWGKKRDMTFTMITGPAPVSSMRKLEWHSQWKILFLAVLLVLFPFIVRYQSLCALWYQRPARQG